MASSLAGKMIYYWIFILGGVSVSYFLKLATEGMDFIVLLIALTLIYWGMEFIKFRNRQKRGAQPPAAKRNGTAGSKRK